MNKRTMLWAMLGTTMTAAVVLPACSETVDPPPIGDQAAVEFKAEAVVTDDAFEADVTVLPTSLVIAKTTASKSLAAIKVGSVVVGEPGPVKDRNPYGFLRRVVGQKDLGDSVSFETEEAELMDAVNEAHMNLDSDQVAYDLSEWGDVGATLVDAPSDAALGLKTEGPKADPKTPKGFQASGKNGGFTFGLDERPIIDRGPIHVLVGATVTASPKFKAKIDLVDCKWKGLGPLGCAGGIKIKNELKVDAGVKLDASAWIKVQAASQGEAPKATYSFLKKPKLLFTYTGFAGIPFQVFGNVEATCSASTEGVLDAKWAVNMKGYPRASFGHDEKKGWFFDGSNLDDIHFSWAPPSATKASVSAQCGLDVKLELRIAGIPAHGPHASFGPYIKAKTEPDCVTRVTLTPGVGAHVGVDRTEIDVKVHKWSMEWKGHDFDIPLKSLATTVGVYCVGGCADQADGYLCVPGGDDKKPHLLECKGGKTITERTCDTFCVAQPNDPSPQCM